MFFLCLKATPRLSEDKVKQCVDPKLKSDYPPKAVAKVLTRPLFGELACGETNLPGYPNSKVKCLFTLNGGCICAFADGCCCSFMRTV